MLRRARMENTTKTPSQRAPRFPIRISSQGTCHRQGLLRQFEIKWAQCSNTNSLLLKSSAILQNAFARESLITGKAYFCVGAD